eukprot:TRINITY_DN2124_c0_g1_i1.p1 TRINITY_DN2124_c0_g1~~TRINITY_DN2124_c0_g1_i1.p1  ORF type:complete len:555 (+),score=118.51 TRINITY_DN2124_c0_g1_i1:43-1707(+)
MKLVSLALLLSAAVVAFGDTIKTTGTYANGTVRIAALSTVSGRWADIAQYHRVSWQLWLDHIDQIGGLKLSASTYGAEIVIIDVGANATTDMVARTTNATKDIATGAYGTVHAIIAPYSSTLTALVPPLANHLPVFAPGAAADSVYVCDSSGTGQCYNSSSDPPRRYNNLLGTLASATNYFDITLSLARIHRVKKIALVWDDSTFGNETCTGAKAKAEEFGMTAVYRSVLTTSSATDIKKSGAELVIGCTYADTCTNLVQQFKTLKWYPNATALTGCMSMPSFTATLGKDARYTLGPVQWHHLHRNINYREPYNPWGRMKDMYMYTTATGKDPSPEQFRTAYKAKSGGLEPTYHSASALAGLYALHLSLLVGSFGGPNQNTTQDPLSTDNILRAIDMMAQGSWGTATFSGYLGFDPSGRMEQSDDFTIVTYDNNTSEQVLIPIAIATSDFDFPVPSFEQRICQDANKCGAHGVCAFDGTCTCYSPWSGATCTSHDIVIRTLLEQNHCRGLYVAAIVLLVIFLVLLFIIVGVAWSRRHWLKLAVSLKDEHQNTTA